ncbi:hypothetical protein JW962_04125 [Candidatus Dojkabacteria bacterium]|nr:hypothetical protein [Candidatus Dojkabacteria bacterium]
MNVLRRLFEGRRQTQEAQVSHPEPEDTLPQEPDLGERRLDLEKRQGVHPPYYAAELAITYALNKFQKKVMNQS